MNFTVAESATVAELCALFNLAFSDYIQPMVLTEPIMELKLLRDGTDYSVSPLAVEQDEPVGFILSSIGNWQGKKTAYNGGTGVVPQARGKALTQQMYGFILPKFREQGVEQCLLEVIQDNTRAFGVYQRLGFEVVRSLRCFKHGKDELSWHLHVPQGVDLTHVAAPNWELYQTFWDVEPSWQHHIAAIDRSISYAQFVEARVEGICIGYGVVYPMTGAIAHIAVSPAWRHKGIGQALLQQLVEIVIPPAVSLINVDGKGESLLGFLEHRKMTEIMPQYEMILSL